MTEALRTDPRTYLRVRPEGDGPWCYMEPCELPDVLDGAPAAGYQIEEVQMTDEEWLALPEFEGW